MYIGYVEKNGKKYYVIDDPRPCNDPEREGMWEVMAQTEMNEEGEYEVVKVFWDELPEYTNSDTDDVELACDWADYEIIEYWKGIR